MNDHYLLKSPPSILVCLFLVLLVETLLSSRLVCAEAAILPKSEVVKELSQNAELDEIKKRLEINRIKVEAITKYLKGNVSFLDNYSSDILLNLAETLYDYADLKHTFEIILFNQNDSQATGPPTPDFKIAIIFLSEIIEKRGFDEAIDKFFYLRAICYEEQAMTEKAADDLMQIVSRYRFSTLFPEAVFRLGEYYFSTGQIAMAIDTYLLNKPHRSSKFYDKTMYKLGWSYYRARDYIKAVDYFLEVAQAAFSEKPEGSEGRQEIKPKTTKKLNRVNLADEALTYVALSYVNFGTPDEIETFFSLNGKPYASKLLDKIGDAFSEQAKFEEAITVYKTLLSSFPLALELPSVHKKIISILEDTVTREPNTFATKREFISSYSPGSPWFEQNKEEVADTKLLDTLEQMIVETAAYYMKQARVSDDSSTYESSLKLYRQYLTIFDKSRRANLVNFLMADALFALERYEEAVAEYEKSAWEYSDKRFQEKSAYAVILTYEEILKLEVSDSAEGEKNGEKMIAAIERFLDEFPSASNAAAIRIKEVEIYFSLGNYDEVIAKLNKARPSLRTVEQKIMTATFFSDAYFNQGNYRMAEIEYGVLSTLAEAASNYTLQRKAERQRVVSLLNMGQSFKKREDLDSAAEMFERANVLSNSTEESRFALGEAIKIYLETRKWSKFDNALIHFQNQFSDRQRVAKFLLAAGKVSEENFQYLQAASYFERASGLSNDGDQVKDYLLVAANNYQKAGNIEKAVTIFTRLSRLATLEGRKKIEYLFRAGELLDKQGASSEALKIYREVVSRHRKLTFKGESGNAYFFGKSRFILLDPELSRYMEQKLVHPFKESFKNKADFMQRLTREYIEISKLEVHEFTSRSLFTIGQIFENFSTQILKSESPEELSEEEKEEYTFMLEERAFPYEQNAEKTYKKNIKLARKKSVTNAYVDLSYRRLALLSPALYKREETAFPLEIFNPEPTFMEELEIKKEKGLADTEVEAVPTGEGRERK